MEFKKKLSLLMMTFMLVILVLSYAIIYYFFYQTTYKDTLERQEVSVDLNRRMAINFLSSVYRTAVQFVSDQSLGNDLSVEGDDPMELLRCRESLQSQFAHYSAHQALDNTYYYKNVLFISDSIPIATVFENYTLSNNPYVSSNIVFSNTNVKNEDWYQKAVDNVISVFVNEDTQEFCIARRLNNTYYRGPHLEEGNAVMVVSISLDQLGLVFGNVQITKNSGYILLDEEKQLLYSSNESIPAKIYQSAIDNYEELPTDGTGMNISLSGENYIVSKSSVPYGISFLFLTPENDISSSIMPVMHTYSLIYLGITLIATIAAFFLAGRLSRPLVLLSHAIGNMEDTRNFDKSTLPISSEKEIVTLERSFEQLIDKTNLLIEDIQVQMEQKQRSQLQTLQAQINPHFIFNAMDMVNWLALSRGCHDIARIVDSIAILMRYSITDADSMVDIFLEIANIREFISIYQLRHDYPVRFSCEISPRETVHIPMFTLQPLVENSVRHASPPPRESLDITVTVHRGERWCVVEVSDNGTNGDAEQLNRHLEYLDSSLEVSSGFGIRNVNERLHLRFRNSPGLRYFNQAGGGLTARIILPREDAKVSSDGETKND